MRNRSQKLKVAILGSGNIGTDLLVKIQRSSFLECVLFAGRNLQSKGMQTAKGLGFFVSDESIHALLAHKDLWDLAFDATSAKDHLVHWNALASLGKPVIDLTPSYIGKQIIPAINIEDMLIHQNVNMVSCGGQASIPLAYAISQTGQEISYIEVVSSIASNSAGPATRINIDEYIHNTEEGIRTFTKCQNVKAILILNPAQPCIDMQTTVSLKMKSPKMDLIQSAIMRIEAQIQRYVPGYQLIVAPIFEQNRLFVSVRVKGRGDYLPSYAGNLDIINCAAIAAAEEYARQQIQNREMVCQKY